MPYKQPTKGRLLIKEQAVISEEITITVFKFPIAEDKDRYHHFESCPGYGSCLSKVSASLERYFSCAFCPSFKEELDRRRGIIRPGPGTDSLSGPGQGPDSNPQPRFTPEELAAGQAVLEKAMDACIRLEIKSKIAFECRRGLDPALIFGLEDTPGFTTWNQFFSEVKKRAKAKWLAEHPEAEQ